MWLAESLGLDEQSRGAAEQRGVVNGIVGWAAPVLAVDLVGVQDVPAKGGDDRLDQPGFGVGFTDALAGPPVAVEAFHALLEGVEQALHGFLPVVGQHAVVQGASRMGRTTVQDGGCSTGADVRAPDFDLVLSASQLALLGQRRGQCSTLFYLRLP
jgi:hypothetical protein